MPVFIDVLVPVREIHPLDLFHAIITKSESKKANATFLVVARTGIEEKSSNVDISFVDIGKNLRFLLFGGIFSYILL